MSVDRYAVLGHPVAHSRSPAIHAAFAAQTGQQLSYDKLECPLDGFASTVQQFAHDGALGCNVTVPFKFEAYALAARRTPRAELAGAANTLSFTPSPPGRGPGRGELAHDWLADNTDGPGLLRDIEHNARRPLAGQRVLLLGAGGAAAGVLGSLIAARPHTITLVNRSPAKAADLISSHQAWADQHGVALHLASLEAPGQGFDLLINATAASLSGSALALPAQLLRPGALAVDMMYGPAAAPFLAQASAQGAEVRDGLGMLVEQAAEAFALWRGVRPDTAPVLASLRAEVS